VKRSFINGKIREAIAFCEKQNVHLPAWATWSPDTWRDTGPEADTVRRCGLGWDVTDFGSHDYAQIGLLAFTLRNGLPSAAGRRPDAKDYCEKFLLVDEGQVTPIHFHWSKMEDIINRAHGRLVLRLWNADRETEALDETGPVTVDVDGIRRTLPAGGTVILGPGESITLPPYLYHDFRAEPGGGMVLGGEVSRVNDDTRDNRFLEPLPRYAAIEEDEPPAFVLCNEYPDVRGA
jgi:D-lyxose ketol-isomerase